MCRPSNQKPSNQFYENYPNIKYQIYDDFDIAFPFIRFEEQNLYIESGMEYQAFITVVHRYKLILLSLYQVLMS